MSAKLLIQVQRDLAVRTGAEFVAAFLQRLALTLKVVKLAVDDDLKPLVLIGNRLIARPEPHNAQSRMSESHTSVLGDPEALVIRPSVIEGSCGPLERLQRNRFTR